MQNKISSGILKACTKKKIALKTIVEKETLQSRPVLWKGN